ncbi:MAG TPA: membrane-bound lytic murein transglycosylase MltF [Casimicrobiaceae bacterium]
MRRTAVLAGAGALVLCGCGPTQEPPSTTAGNALIVVVRPGPTTWFAGENDRPAGLDHDLIERFAREQKLPLMVVVAQNATQLMSKVARGEAHIGAGGLFQMPPPDARDAGARVLWSEGYHSVEPVLIYGGDGYKPQSWSDLTGATIAYAEHTGLESSIAAVRSAHSEVRWKPLDPPSADALIAQVSEGTIDYAIVASSDAAAMRSVYLDFDVAFPVGAPRELAWAVAPGHPELRAAVDRFFERLRSDGTLARYAERYFGARDIERIDAGIFRDRIDTTLPQYRPYFYEAQAQTGIEWRLLAAVAYQESQWDPVATSETGVRGLMQLTEDTARMLGVADRLDAKSSALGAARYLRTLKDKLPARIAEPDRTWLALAAFNIGIGHLEDARVLAQRQKLNPDVWSDVRKALPLLAQQDYFLQAKNGYARGGMPVAFVDRVRAYYDVLLRTEPSYHPRLRVSQAEQTAALAR